MTRVLVTLLILGETILSPALLAQEATEPLLRPELPKEWSRAVRGFRREHNFALSYGHAFNRWKGHVSDDPRTFSFQVEAHDLRLQYSFHLPLIGGLGYYLGTQASMTMASPGSDKSGSELSYDLPGLNLGLILNLSDRLRIGTGLEFGWQRIEKLGLPSGYPSHRISVTGESLSLSGQIDYFYELSWAIQLHYELSQLTYASKNNDLSLNKHSRTWSLGILKHLI